MAEDHSSVCTGRGDVSVQPSNTAQSRAQQLGKENYNGPVSTILSPTAFNVGPSTSARGMFLHTGICHTPGSGDEEIEASRGKRRGQDRNMRDERNSSDNGYSGYQEAITVVTGGTF